MEWSETIIAPDINVRAALREELDDRKVVVPGSVVEGADLVAV